GLGTLPSSMSTSSLSSSSMISLHNSMHSSQMYTPGPAISFLTCSCTLPQNEHLSWPFSSPNLNIRFTPSSAFRPDHQRPCRAVRLWSGGGAEGCFHRLTLPQSAELRIVSTNPYSFASWADM